MRSIGRHWLVLDRLPQLEEALAARVGNSAALLEHLVWWLTFLHGFLELYPQKHASPFSSWPCISPGLVSFRAQCSSPIGSLVLFACLRLILSFLSCAVCPCAWLSVIISLQCAELASSVCALFAVVFLFIFVSLTHAYTLHSSHPHTEVRSV